MKYCDRVCNDKQGRRNCRTEESLEVGCVLCIVDRWRRKKSLHLIDQFWWYATYHDRVLIVISILAWLSVVRLITSLGSGSVQVASAVALGNSRIHFGARFIGRPVTDVIAISWPRRRGDGWSMFLSRSHYDSSCLRMRDRVATRTRRHNDDVGDAAVTTRLKSVISLHAINCYNELLGLADGNFKWLDFLGYGPGWGKWFPIACCFFGMEFWPN